MRRRSIFGLVAGATAAAALPKQAGQSPSPPPKQFVFIGNAESYLADFGDIRDVITSLEPMRTPFMQYVRRSI